MTARHQLHRIAHLAHLHLPASLLHQADRLAGMLTARGQEALDTIVPDATHTWRGARSELPYALAFASQHLTVRRGARPPPGNAAPGPAGPA